MYVTEIQPKIIPAVGMVNKNDTHTEKHFADTK